MVKTFLIKNKFKVGLFILILILILSYVISDWYWKNRCGVIGCDNVFRDGLLAPLHALSLYTPFILLPFFFLPVHYFKSWLLKIASWSVPIALIFVLSESPTGGGMLAFGRELMVVLATLVIANLTFVFLLYTYATHSERYQKISGLWYVLLLGVLLYITLPLANYLV